MLEKWMPSFGDILFIVILALLIFLLPNYLLNDGSTGWHLVIGQYILEHWQLPQQDLISYTFPNKASVNYEWLFDLSIAFFDKVGGIKLVYLSVASAIALLVLAVYDSCRRTGAHFLLSLGLCMLSVPVMAIHWLVRPHVVTFFGVLIFTQCLDAFYKNKLTARKLYFYLLLTMLIWVNCHPAFLLGLAILAIYLATELAVFLCLENGEPRQEALSRSKILAFALLAALITTLINPYGLHLYEYIANYSQQSTVLANTEEFLSPSFHGALQSTCLEFMYLLLIVGFAASKSKPPLAKTLVVLAFAHLSLSGSRNMPLFAIVATPFIAELISKADLLSLVSSQNVKFAGWGNIFAGIYKKAGEIANETEVKCTRHVIPILAVLILGLSCLKEGRFFDTQLIEAAFDQAKLPTTTLQCLLDKKLDYRKGFTFDNWGGYIRYKTGMRVFIDDRVDFYGQPFYLDYAEASSIDPGWRSILDKRNIQWVLFPKNSLLIGHLKNEPGWQILCEDKCSSLYIRRGNKS